MSSEKTYTVTEAAKVLGLTEYTARKKIRDGNIKAIKGSSDREGYRIPFDELMRYTENHGLSELSTGFGLIGDVFKMGLQKIFDSLNSTKKKIQAGKPGEKYLRQKQKSKRLNAG